MRGASCATATARIYIAGPIEVAKQILREECMREGLCVTIEPTDFIYTGGEEKGYVVGLANYPRFPASQEALDRRAYDLMLLLRERTFQDSAMLVTPQTTLWISRRDEQ